MGARGRRRLALTCLGLALGCAAARAPELDPTEHVVGEHRRVIREPVDRLWPAVLAALDAEGIRVRHVDRGHGTIASRPQRYLARDVQKRLGEIGDVARARSAGLRAVSELEITYYLLLDTASDGESRLTIRSAIEAVDASDSILPTPGTFEVLPRRIPVPSRGVLERELMRRIGADLFTAEEMLLVLGEPGVD